LAFSIVVCISYTVQVTIIVIIKHDQETYTIYRMAPLFIILNDPNRDFKDTPLFDVEYLRNDAR